MWNYKNTADTYPTCNKIDGYNGEFWPPERTKEDSLKMYATDMCRLGKKNLFLKRAATIDYSKKREKPQQSQYISIS